MPVTIPLTPAVTLTANLESIIAGAAEAGYLQVTLCGYGPVLPCVAGTAMLADAGIPQLIGPQAGSTPLSVELFGNDVIQPVNQTFYSVAVLDQNKNVIQSGMYQFNGAGSFDLSEAAQFLPPYGFAIARLTMAVCSGAVPGHIFTAPGEPVVMVMYNGIILPEGLTFPTLSYTAVGATITLNFPVESGDRIYALCVV